MNAATKLPHVTRVRDAPLLIVSDDRREVEILAHRTFQFGWRESERAVTGKQYNRACRERQARSHRGP